MPVHCLTAARFTMNAEILRWAGTTETGTIDPPAVTTPDGQMVGYQDPITGEIYNKWVPGEPTGVLDNPVTTTVDESYVDLRTIPCLARGIVDGGIRVAGTTERFGDMYENIDYVKLWVPARVRISKRDRVTNIRHRKGGRVIWKNEEGDGSPTIFNVNGVTPLFDAFNNHTESYVMLERASG